MNPSPNLVLVGPMGAGKTSIGKQLAERLGLAFFDADREIEAHTGASVATIFDCEGEAGFRSRERKMLSELLDGDGRLVATGGGVVLDQDNRDLLRERGFVLHLHADVDTQLARLSRDKSRPLLQRPDREAVLHAMATERMPLYAEVADLSYDTSGQSCHEALAVLSALLARQWQQPRAKAS